MRRVFQWTIAFTTRPTREVERAAKRPAALPSTSTRMPSSVSTSRPATKVTPASFGGVARRADTALEGLSLGLRR
jgi:hypothetical protein